MYLGMVECHIPFLGTVALALTSYPLKKTLSEYGHVAYQMKGNEIYDNIPAKFLHSPCDP